MTKKIDCWYVEYASRDLHTGGIGHAVFAPLDPPSEHEKLATVVIHEGRDKHERMFTESEVRAMMEDVKAIAAEHSRKCYTNRIEQMTPPAPVVFIIDSYLQKKHSITPDPA